MCAHGAASCRWRDPAALNGTAGPPGNVFRVLILRRYEQVRNRLHELAGTMPRIRDSDGLNPQTAIEVPPGGRDLLDNTRAIRLDVTHTLHYKVSVNTKPRTTLG